VSHAFITRNGDYMLELHDEILIEANAVAELERERIDAILDGWQVALCKCDVCQAVREIRASIKGEQK
jgi:hypothetical protein